METMDYIIKTLEKLVNIPSPSGFTKEVMEFVKAEAEGFGFKGEYTNKGGYIIKVKGKTNETLGLSAHVDTLGAMVRSIDSEGLIRFTLVGGYTMHSVEGAYCTLHTRDGRSYTGTILNKSPSVHSYDDARTIERTDRNMLIRIDEPVKSREDVLALGINSGDYVSFDAKFRITDNGYIKSRHLDDKASVAVLLGMLKDMSEGEHLPDRTLKLLISNYEEVGFGASWVPEDITELLAVDMGAVGDDLNGSEYTVSICAKDSRGPYDYEMTNRLIALAKENEIDYVVDIFPHYGSDVSAALSGGNNIRGALIGQGVHASHGMERTHRNGMENTLKLLKVFVGLPL
ncbi:MAG TPA: M42 family metallopeptidase [Mobilitalea sp.]|nr:M42 family metallopeptidase [Mobilitalea sp.]